MYTTVLMNFSICILPIIFANYIQEFIDKELAITTKDNTLRNEFRSIASCIAKKSSKELFWKPTIVLKIGRNQSKSEDIFINEMHKRLTSENVMYMITLDNVKNNWTLDNTDGSSYLFVDYFKDCETMSHFNFNALQKNMKYLNILKYYSTDICMKYFKNVGEVVADYDMSFLVKQRVYNLYTFIPYIDHITCKQEVKYPALINTCLNGQFSRKQTLFPKKKPTDLKKCPFKVGLGPLYPFAMIENKSLLHNYDALDEKQVTGMDYEIVKILAKKFNATLELHYIYKYEENAFINVEYVEYVINGSLEACAGGLYRIFGDVVDYSGVYAKQSVMWIYSADRETRTWENMVSNIEGLYLFIVFYFCYATIWFVICKFDRYSVFIGNTFITSWGALVGTASLQEPRTLKQKILNIVYLNMCLHLNVYISIQLFSFFTVLDPPEVLKTNEDIMKSGRTAYLTTLAKYFTKDDNYERFANTSKECNGFLDCGLVSLMRKGVTVFIQGYFYNFQAATAVNEEARMLRSEDSLLTVYYEMIIRKESPLVYKFQKIVERLFEGGIPNKLFEESIGVIVVSKAKIATQNIMGRSYSCQSGCRLSLRQFSGVFFVWGIGCALSCVLFVAEILWRRNRRTECLQAFCS